MEKLQRLSSRHNKKQVRKVCNATLSKPEPRQGNWTVKRGELKRSRGRPKEVESLFKVVAEKIPYEYLVTVEKDMREQSLTPQGVYVAHDSVGAARYIGRGNIFNRLRASKKKHVLELHYFSFYIVLDKQHEREIETLLIRAAGHLLSFNTKKKRPTINAGNIADYEGGTIFYERQSIKGKKVQSRRKKSSSSIS